MRYAQINDDGLCISDSMLAGPVDAPNMIEIADDLPSPLGQRWAGNQWAHVPEPEAIPTWRITKLAFKNRFPRLKWIAARQAASADSMLVDFFESFELATYIDLERQDTRDSVTAMSSPSIPESIRLTPEELSAVLDVSASPDEIPRGV